MFIDYHRKEQLTKLQYILEYSSNEIEESKKLDKLPEFMQIIVNSLKTVLHNALLSNIPFSPN